MCVLIVETNPDLGAIWRRHLERVGCRVKLATSQDSAIEVLRSQRISAIVLNLVLEGGSAIAVADFASFRRPEVPVIFVTNTSFFSDGSIFRHIPNARALFQTETPPEDLAAMVQYFTTVS